LPHGDTIIERASTFSDITNDDSYNSRVLTSQALFNEIIDRPWGWGMGFKTAAKLAGQSAMIAPIDNGYGDLLWTLGILGGAAYLAGLLMITLQMLRSKHRSAVYKASTLRILTPLAATVLLMLLLANCAAFSILGITGVWLWFYIGLASAPFPRRERAMAPASNSP
jgi:O-antigen ligase